MANSWNSNQGDTYVAATLLFREHCIQFDRLGDRHRSIHLAATPPPAAGGSVTASAHSAQLPFHRVSISRPGVVSPDLPSAFARCAAYGDVIAAALALLSLLSLPSAAGVVIAWVFNLWGSVDLLNAFYQANHAGLLAGQLGATYFIPTVIVAILLITHALAFRILLQRENESVRREGRQAA